MILKDIAWGIMMARIRNYRRIISPERREVFDEFLRPLRNLNDPAVRNAHPDGLFAVERVDFEDAMEMCRRFHSMDEWRKFYEENGAYVCNRKH